MTNNDERVMAGPGGVRSSADLSPSRDFNELNVVYIFMNWSNSIPYLQRLHLQQPTLHLP